MYLFIKFSLNLYLFFINHQSDMIINKYITVTLNIYIVIKMSLKKINLPLNKQTYSIFLTNQLKIKKSIL